MSLTKRFEVDFTGTVSKTRQEFKQDADVNHIMKKFKKVMGVEFLSKYRGALGGQFGDFSDVPDYRTALDIVDRSKAMFMALPANLRKRFDNDAATFLDFANDPKNSDEMVSLGLAKQAAKPVEAATPPVPAAG